VLEPVLEPVLETEPQAAAVAVADVTEVAPLPAARARPRTSSRLVAVAPPLEQQQQEEAAEIIRAAEPFTEADLLAAWEAYAKKLRKQNKVALATTMLQGKWSLEGNQIGLKVSNAHQMEMLDECRLPLLQFMRRRVNNGQVDLRIEVMASKEAPVEFLTSKERYDRMMEHRPALEILRKRLDLDLS